jgi:AcrR family transcriptional regulator
MLTTMASSVKVAGREAIVVAAERLIALRGAQVPLRDIAVAAGHRNNSAVQYHFASREDLVEAVIDHRAPVLEGHRLERLVALEGDGAGDDVRSLLHALVGPLLDAPLADGDWHYARFLEQARVLPDAIARDTLQVHRASVALILSRLRPLVPKLSHDEWELRLQIFGSCVYSLAADHERRLEAGIAADDRSVAETAILDALTAVMLAKPTRRAATA